MKPALLSFCVLALVLAGPASGQPAPPDLPAATEMPTGVPEDAEAPTITNPQWLRRPSGIELSGYYPTRATQMGMSGNATLLCTVAAGGRMSDCRVLGEYPRDMGFGAAALRMADQFVMGPQPGASATSIVGATVAIPVTFRFPGSMDPISVFGACYHFAAAAAEAAPQDAEARRVYLAWRVTLSYAVLTGRLNSVEGLETYLREKRINPPDGYSDYFQQRSSSRVPRDLIPRLRSICRRATPPPRPSPTTRPAASSPPASSRPASSPPAESRP